MWHPRVGVAFTCRNEEASELHGALHVEKAGALLERARVGAVLAVYCRMALTAFGVSAGFACSINATVPLTAGAAMLVPVSVR